MKYSNYILPRHIDYFLNRNWVTVLDGIMWIERPIKLLPFLINAFADGPSITQKVVLINLAIVLDYIFLTAN